MCLRCVCVCMVCMRVCMCVHVLNARKNSSCYREETAEVFLFAPSRCSPCNFPFRFVTNCLKLLSDIFRRDDGDSGTFSRYIHIASLLRGKYCCKCNSNVRIIYLPIKQSVFIISMAACCLVFHDFFMTSGLDLSHTDGVLLSCCN